MLRKAIEFLASVISGSTPEDEPALSVILLLESRREVSRESVLRLAAQAWTEPEGEPALRRSPRWGSYRIQAANLLFGLRVERAPYPAPGRQPGAARQRAWDQHQAWMAVDYLEGEHTPDAALPSCYKLLFLMANQLWDDNCLALYLPREDVTVPNMGDLISSIRWAGNNGTPLPFLHEADEREA